MDWFSIASALCERQDRPTALIDRGGQILLLNRAMETVLGVNRFEVEGRSWVEICNPREGREGTERWLSEALRGAIQRCTTTALSKPGLLVFMELELSLLGSGLSQGLLISAVHVEQQRLMQPGSARHLDYEVQIAADFGRLGRISLEGVPLPVSNEEQHCFAVVHGLEQPCSHCPLRRDPDEPWPRCAVRATSGGAGVAFEVTVAERISDAWARIRLCTVSETVLTAMHQAKLQELARRANLSLREQEIMFQLMTGRSIDEIAEAVGITPRTVKFHQANILQKLGADSRVDMLRLVF